MKFCFPVEKNEGLQSKISGHFGSAPLLLVVDTETQELVEMKRSGQADQPGRNRLAQLLAGPALDALVVTSMGQGAQSRLKSAGVKIYLAAGVTINDNLLCMADQRLAELNANQVCSHGQHGAGHGHHKQHGHGAGHGCGCH